MATKTNSDENLLGGSPVKKEGAKKNQGAVKVASGPCPCGCGETPRSGVFVPGHDGRVSGWFRQIEAKKKKVDDLPKSAQVVWASWVRLGKPGGNHPHVREAAVKAVKVTQPAKAKKDKVSKAKAEVAQAN